MKKLCSAFLAAAVLVCSMLPLNVSAADAVTYTETFQPQANTNYVDKFLATDEWCMEAADISQGQYPGTEPQL